MGWIPVPKGGDAPYVCRYTLTAHEKDVFDQLDQEDQVSDAQHANSDCQGTKRSGNIAFQGNKEHWIIQLDYISTYPADGEREFAIPNASLADPSKRGYADIVNLSNGNMFEIKPNNQPGTQAGQTEVANYIAKANVHYTNTLPTGVVWNTGTAYNNTMSNGLGLNVPKYFPMNNGQGQYLEATLAAPGVIGYQYINVNPTPNPIVVPQSVLDKFKELTKRLKGNFSNFKPILAEYMKQNPELLTYIKGAAIGAGVAIVVGTILEDVITAGAGIADDWASFVLAYRIVRFAVAY